VAILYDSGSRCDPAYRGAPATENGGYWKGAPLMRATHPFAIANLSSPDLGVFPQIMGADIGRIDVAHVVGADARG